MRRARWRLRQRMASRCSCLRRVCGRCRPGLGVAAHAGDGDAVDGGVDLAVAAAVEAMAVGVAGADGDRGDAAGAGELGVAGEALGAGDLADELARGQRPEAGLGQQLRRDLGDELGDLGLERVDGRGRARAGGAARRGRSGRAPSARCAPGAGRSWSTTSSTTTRSPGRSARARGRAGARAGRCRARRASEPAVRGDRPAAGCRARRRPARRPATAPRLRVAPRGRPPARRSDRTCRGRGWRAARRPSTASRPGRRARRRRAGTARRRPRRDGSPPAPRPARRPGRAPNPAPRRSRARRPRWSFAQHSPLFAPTAAIVCERLCMSAPSTIMAFVPFHLD